MLGPSQKLLLKVIVLIAAILIGTFFILPLFGFDLMKYLVGSVDIEEFFQPQDLSSVLTDYREYADLGHGGMILEKDAGVNNIDEVLEQRMLVTDCTSCSGCYEIYLDNPNIRAYSCPDCGKCGGITENNRFKNCLECNPTSGECSLCEDWGKDYELCKKIENCILECYSNAEDCNKYGCPLGKPFSGIAHNGVSFDISTLKNVLDSCTPKLLKMDMGHNIEKELCYFDTSDVSYYDFDRPHDFYLNYSLFGENSIKSLYLYEGDLRLTPFYKEGGETFERYRVYVAIDGEEENMNYEVSIGRYYWDWFWGEQSKYSCKIGEIETDSNGFGYAEFTEIDPDCGNYDKWKADPEKYPLNGIKVTKKSDEVKWFDVYATFYANMPESNEVWTRELRYSHCNFNTNPEPYLSEKPWWILLPDPLSSPFNIDGDVNSAVKVFYDSTIPGGGTNSNKRGNIKISLGRLDTDFMRNCKFDLYICSQDAFAEFDEETIFELTDFFTYLNPANLYKIEGVDRDGDGYNETELIIYNYFEFGLHKNYTLEEIKSAIKTGFRLWEQNQFPYISFGTGINWLTNDNNDGIYEDDWEEGSGAILYDEDCWNQIVNNYMRNNNEKAIIGNCPDNICREKLKVRIAFKYTKPNATAFGDGWKRSLYPTITFCSFETSAAFVPLELEWQNWPVWPADQISDADGVTRWSSADCPDERPYVVSCLTRNYWDPDDLYAVGITDQNKYSHDDIVEILSLNETDTPGEHCNVTSRNIKGGSEQKRTVIALCSNYKPDIKWPVFYDETVDIRYQTIESDSCPPGTSPVSCFVDQIWAPYDPDDLLIDMWIEGNKCKATFRDYEDEAGMRIKVGVACLNAVYGFDNEWTGYDDCDEGPCSGADGCDVKRFYESCSSGKMVSCMTKTDYSDGKYYDDSIQTISKYGDLRCDFYVNDHAGYCQQNRTAGVVCASSSYFV